jgi:hypothetical protein
MMKDDKLIRIPLQFFGESAEDEDEDLFGEDYDEDEDPDEDEDSDEDDDSDEDEASDEEDSDENGAEEESDGKDTNAELIKLLKAQGYVGDDLKALTADMKKKSEDNAKKAAKKEREAAMAAGKSHIKSGKPQRGMSGDGMDGFSQKDLREVSACLVNRKGMKSQSQRAVIALERRARAGSK